MLITKRDGTPVDFDEQKIFNAISKANDAANPADKIDENEIRRITAMVVLKCKESDHTVSVEEIQDMVVDYLALNNHCPLMRLYGEYRFKRALIRKANTTDESILKLIKGTNRELAEENANKSTVLCSTQRDYMAGEVSRDVTRRLMLPEKITKAHDEGVIHFHDMDYFVQPLFNCCLQRIGDVLDNGTVMNDKLIESPHTFQVACTVFTQVIANIASNQYGGQSLDTVHLGKYLRRSKEKFEREVRDDCEGTGVSEEIVQKIVNTRLKDELSAGVQTIQYQINTLMTTNGQSPFVTLFLYLREDDEYVEENAMIIEEILKQRIQGIKNEAGVYITPAFPKLVYVLDKCNNLTGGKYDYLTEIAVKCTSKRMYPDYISAKKMRENYAGNVFSPMGCNLGDEVITYKLFGVPYVESSERMWLRLAAIFEVCEQNPGDHRYLYMDTPDGVEIYDSKVGFTKMKRVIRNISKDWCRVKLSNGRCITVTPDHPFETENRGVVHAIDLRPDDQIFVNPSKIELGVKEINYNSDAAWALGLILCDGSFVDNICVSIAAHGEDDIERKFIQVMKDMYEYNVKVVEQHRGIKGNYKDLRVTSEINDGKPITPFSNFLISKFGGRRKLDRQIPSEVFTWTRQARMAFLAGMFDADGYISPYLGVAEIGSTNKELAIQQMLLAQSLDMPSRVYMNHYKGTHIDKIRYQVSFVPTEEFVNALECKKKRDRYYLIQKNSMKQFEVGPIVNVMDIEPYTDLQYSYDVTTESEHFEVSGIYSHNCRSFLAPWKDENGEYQFEGRFNQGVVSINLPQIGIIANGDMEKFWNLMEERLQLCFEALMCRHEHCKTISTDNSPLHWQYGVISRLPPHASIEPLLYGGYSSISLGYIGLYEVTKLMTGVSHTDPKGFEFAMKVMKRLRKACDDWKAETNIGFALYGTPAESLCYRFARIDRERFGVIKDITDKGYYTNSYHVDVREHIDAFDKLKFENQFQPISSGGCISYVEIPNMAKNLDALRDMVKFIYNNIQYAEFNTKSDYCQVCGFDGEITLNEKLEWECPVCGNKDHDKLNIVRRTCGYLGEKFWNVGKTKEISKRVLHVS